MKMVADGGDSNSSLVPSDVDEKPRADERSGGSSVMVLICSDVKCTMVYSRAEQS